MKKFLLFLFLFTSSLGVAQNQANRAVQFNLEGKLALQGYDPVAYFQGKAKKGKESLAVTYMGVTYYFSSAENKGDAWMSSVCAVMLASEGRWLMSRKACPRTSCFDFAAAARLDAVAALLASVAACSFLKLIPN